MHLQYPLVLYKDLKEKCDLADRISNGCLAWRFVVVWQCKGGVAGQSNLQYPPVLYKDLQEKCDLRGGLGAFYGVC